MPQGKTVFITEAQSLEQAVDIILNKKKHRLTWADNVKGEALVRRNRALEAGRENKRRKRNVWDPNK